MDSKLNSMEINNKSKVFVAPAMDPEILAMLQAFYSRSDKSIEGRLESLGDTSDKIKEALKTYYLGYGHASIGDCSDVTLFIEDVSMLLAKVVQDDQLYNGQETSSRFFDFSKRDCYNPFLNHPNPLISNAAAEIQDAWINLYNEYKDPITEMIRQNNPMTDDTDESQWKRATAARAFDVLRSLLPCGITTKLSWKGSLRRLHERLSLLSTHPLEEVRNFAVKTHSMLREVYPNSFNTLNVLRQELRDTYPYYSNYIPYYGDLDDGLFLDSKLLNIEFQYELYGDPASLNSANLQYLRYRRRFDPVPNTIFDGNFVFKFFLDYGSFRDIQRHRNGKCLLPIVGEYQTDFHPWYLEQFDKYQVPIVREIQRINDLTTSFIDSYSLECETKPDYNFYGIEGILSSYQYLFPLGTIVPVKVEYGLAEAIYVAELRSSNTVHPTLRVVAQNIAQAIRENFDIVVYSDPSKDKFCLKRGNQTIFKNGSSI